MTTRNSMIFSRTTFSTALNLLLHPFSLAAVGLLLINDWVLRAFWPSWWTGKLGDAAWLFFVPYVLALVLAWILPTAKDQDRHTRITFGLAFILTGCVFSLVKTFPTANLVATRISSFLLGTAPSLTLDPTDLLVLPALLISAVFCWHRIRPARLAAGDVGHFRRAVPASYKKVLTPPAPAGQGLAHPAAAWFVIPLVAAVLLADAAAPDLGIGCLELREDGRIAASAGYSNFISNDGGMNWERSQPGSSTGCAFDFSEISDDSEDWRVVEAPQPGTSYRYIPGEEIQVSTGSDSWQTALQLTSLSEAERIYTIRSHAGNPVDRPAPLDALADPKSGNMLFAMGQQGVLVHTAQGQWVWSAAGDYRRLEQFPSADAFALLLGGMALLASGLFLLIYSALAIRWLPKPASTTSSRFAQPLRMVILVLAALAWLGVDILFPPAVSAGYSSTISLMGMAVFAILILPLAIELTIRLARRAPRILPRLAGIALAGALFYLLPYLLWLYSTLPGFSWATVLALAFGLAALGAGLFLRTGEKQI